MKCEEAGARLVEHLFGELRPEVEAELQRHLGGCFNCSAELIEMEQTWGKISKLSQVEPPRLSLERVRAAVNPASRSAAGTFFARANLRNIAAIATAAALIVVGIGIWTFHKPGKEPQQQKPEPTPPAVAQAEHVAWETGFDEDLDFVRLVMKELASRPAVQATEPDTSETFAGRMSCFAEGLEYFKWKWEEEPYSHIDSSLEHMWRDIEKVRGLMGDEGEFPEALEEGRSESERPLAVRSSWGSPLYLAGI